MANQALIDELESRSTLDRVQWVQLISTFDHDDVVYAAQAARRISTSRFGNKVYFRGIVEFTNHCKNDCLYCGIRCSNTEVNRYRLTTEQILECCSVGYAIGFRTFVLQGGEDVWYSTDRLVDLVTTIRASYPDCAITLSIGELDHESYQRLFDVGADRYLLRHETASPSLYSKLHPDFQPLERRLACLEDLKEIGYQVGCGMMLQAPFQTPDDLATDMLFMHDFQPHMVGMGPFIPHHATPFADQPAGDLETTLFFISLVRLMLPDVLLPATTALGTIDAQGREKGILAGANVVMPNLSPGTVRDDYLLYDGKICTGDDASACVGCMGMRMKNIGYEMEIGRGDSPRMAIRTFEAEA